MEERINNAIAELAKLNYTKKELDTFKKSFLIVEEFHEYASAINSLKLEEVKMLVNKYTNEYLADYRKNSVRPVDTKTIVEKTSVAIHELATIMEYDKKKTDALKNAVAKITELSYKEKREV